MRFYWSVSWFSLRRLLLYEGVNATFRLLLRDVPLLLRYFLCLLPPPSSQECLFVSESNPPAGGKLWMIPPGGGTPTVWLQAPPSLRLSRTAWQSVPTAGSSSSLCRPQTRRGLATALFTRCRSRTSRRTSPRSRYDHRRPSLRFIWISFIPFFPLSWSFEQFKDCWATRGGCGLTGAKPRSVMWDVRHGEHFKCLSRATAGLAALEHLFAFVLFAANSRHPFWTLKEKGPA